MCGKKKKKKIRIKNEKNYILTIINKYIIPKVFGYT